MMRMITISLFVLGGYAAWSASCVFVYHKDVAESIERNVLVWDVRPADAYARGHIAGAINIGDAARVLRDDNTEDLIATDRIEKIMGAAGLDPSRETIVYGSRGAVNIPYEQNWVDPESQTKLARKEVSNNAGMSLKRTADLKQLSVLDYCDDCEVLEIILPAEFKTVELE